MAEHQAAKATTSHGAEKLCDAAGKDIDPARDTIVSGQT